MQLSVGKHSCVDSGFGMVYHAQMGLVLLAAQLMLPKEPSMIPFQKNPQQICMGIDPGVWREL